MTALENLELPTSGEGMLYDRRRRRWFRIGAQELIILKAYAAQKEPLDSLGLPLESVHAVIDGLRRLGLLDQPAPSSSFERRWSRVGLLVKFSLGDPARIVVPVHHALRSKLGRTVAGILTALGLLGLIALACHPFPPSSGQPMFGTHTLLIVAALVVIMICHEMAHAVALSLVGSRSPDVGLALMYFFPAAYTDCTPVWTVSRPRRCAVLGAGILLHLMVAGWAALLVHVAGPPWSSDLWAFAILNLGMASTNINPLMKLDGYWILAGILDRPRLRAEAFDALLRRRDASWRRAPLLVAFALASCAWTVVLLISVACTWWWLGQHGYGPLLGVGAAVLLAPLILIRLRRRRERPHWTRRHGSSV